MRNHSKRRHLFISNKFLIFDYSLTIIDMKFIIYHLQDPITKKIRYIGCTKNSLKQRLSQHVYTAKNRCSTPCAKWIKSLLNQGKRPIIGYVSEADESSWEEKEIYYIASYGKLCNLLNLYEGGKGVILDRSNTSLSKNKPLYQCDEHYKVIKLWNSKKEASDCLNISLQSIEKCVQQTQNSNPTAGGFKWVNKDIYDKGTYIKKQKMIKSERRDVKNVVEKFDNKIINIFPTIRDCANNLNIPDHVLRRKLKKGVFKYNGKEYEIFKKI